MRARKVLSLAAFPSLLAALIVLAVVFRRPLWDIFSTTDRLRHWIASAGPTAPLLFIAVQALQVIVFFIPGEIPQVAGGYLFGLWQGTLLSLAGITLGSAFSFVTARVLGVPFVHALFDRTKVERVRHIIESPRARLSFFLLFLIPGIPKDVLCYAAGLSSIRLLVFLPFSAVGRLPGIIGSALMGEAAADRRWILAGTVLFLAVVLFVAGYLLRDRLQGLIERLSRGRSGGETEPSVRNGVTDGDGTAKPSNPEER